MMRKIAVVLAAAAVLGFSQAASAADLGTAPIYRKAPPAPAPFTWTGSYIGGFVGGATSAKDVMTGLPVGTGTFPGTAPATYGIGSSFIGGYTDGYNWQVAPNWVLGYESETGYIGLKGSSTYPGSPTTAVNTRTDGTYSVWSGRIGYAVDRSLIYAKGGVALAKFNTGADDSVNLINTWGGGYRLGYAVGGGYEYAIDPKWSVKAEYLYLGFDSHITTNGMFGATPIATTTSISGIHTGKVGLNYKFDVFGLLFH